MPELTDTIAAVDLANSLDPGSDPSLALPSNLKCLSPLPGEPAVRPGVQPLAKEPTVRPGVHPVAAESIAKPSQQLGAGQNCIDKVTAYFELI